MQVRYAFLVGCPRSGTTWLQLLLAQHPEVATLQETHLFTGYVSPIMSRLQRERRDGRKVGLGKIMTEDETRQLLSTFSTRVLQMALADKPQAKVILEKTPAHIFHIPQILEIFPAAHFIHIIRDPRAVTASLIDASKTWGRSWAPSSPVVAAEMWQNAVRHGLQLPEQTSSYSEVRYEDLTQDATGELSRVLGDLGLEAERESLRAAVDACSAETLRSGESDAWTPKSMDGSLQEVARRAKLEGWRSELSRSQVAAVEYVAGDLMKAVGYEPEDVRRLPPLSVLRQDVFRAGKRVFKALASH